MDIEFGSQVEKNKKRITEVPPGSTFVADGNLYIKSLTNSGNQGFNPRNGLYKTFCEDVSVRLIQAKIVIQEPCTLKL